MTDTIVHNVVIGAARLLATELTAERPQKWQDVLDPTTFEAINNWIDIGVTKTGVSEVNDEVRTNMSEVSLVKLNYVASGGPFQLIALWNAAESDEDFHISLRSYTHVTIKSLEIPEVMHEGKSIPVVFQRA